MTLPIQPIPQHGNGETAASSSLDELSIGDAIRQCPFFDVFSRDLQATIANYLELFTVVAGDKLFAKGDISTCTVLQVIFGIECLSTSSHTIIRVEIVIDQLLTCCDDIVARSNTLLIHRIKQDIG